MDRIILSLPKGKAIILEGILYAYLNHTREIPSANATTIEVADELAKEISRQLDVAMNETV